MKNLKILSLIALISFVGTTSAYAASAENVCSVPAIKIASSDNQATKIQKIVDALKGYRDHIPSYLSAMNGRFELCFDMASPLEISKDDFNEDFAGAFYFEPDPLDSRVVLIAGLKLKIKDAADMGDNPMVSIKTEKANKVIVSGIQLLNFSNGLEVLGNGSVWVTNSTFVGKDEADCECVKVASAEKTMLNGITATNCRVSQTFDIPSEVSKNREL